MLTSLALMALFSATLHLTMQSAVALSADSSQQHFPYPAIETLRK